MTKPWPEMSLATDLYDSYCYYCTRTHRRAATEQRFYWWLDRFPCMHRVTIDGLVYYTGLNDLRAEVLRLGLLKRKAGDAMS